MALIWIVKDFGQPAASTGRYLGLAIELVLISLQQLRLLFEPFQAAVHAHLQHMAPPVYWLTSYSAVMSKLCHDARLRY